MNNLKKNDFGLVRELFEPLDYHLAVPAALAGVTPGRVYVDDVRRPQSAMLHVQHHYYLAGSTENTAFQASLHRLFEDEVFPGAKASGQEVFQVFFTDGWEGVIQDQLLRSHEPILGPRMYFENRGQNIHWRQMIPAGLTLTEVNLELVNDTNLQNLDDLLEELQSERESVDAFLESSFGLVLRNQSQVVTWCLSEYNLGTRCEVGIATTAGFRNQGLATATGAAFVELAKSRGVQRIGWHCWESNLGSRATAIKIGYEKVRDYPSYLCFFDPAVNLAVHGNILLMQGKFTESMPWFQRAFATQNAPAWAYLAGACASASLDEPDMAMRLLEEAARRGNIRRVEVEGNEHLASLRGHPDWGRFLESLAP